MNRFRAILAALALWSAAIAPAIAHAFLDHANPAVGSAVHSSPPSVRLWFSEPLEPAFCAVRVLNEAGNEVDAGDSRIDASDPTLLVATLPVLPPGRYRVVWRVVSVDTHVTEGDFTFDVAR